MSKTKWTEAQIAELIAAKHRGEGSAFLRSVPNATGMKKSRTCDAMGMHLWPSKGLHMHGYEIKTSRSDWLREIQDVTKAEAFAKHCHYWWIVAPKGCVELPELPGRWGLMEPIKGGLRTRKPAEVRDNVELLSFEFLAGLLRAALKNSPSEDALEAARKQGVDEGRKLEKRWGVDSSRDVEVERMSRKCKELESAIEEFEQSSGVRIESYDGGRIGEAVNFLLNANLPSVQRSFNEIERDLSRVGKWIENAKQMLAESIEATPAEMTK